MKVVHLNASDRRGGAALAVHRLHQALRERGIGSRLLVRDQQSSDDSVETLPPEDSVARQRAEAVEHVYLGRNRTNISNTHFSLSLLGPDLSLHPAVRDADLIHLHWVASMQTPASLRRLLRLEKPVVWTLHDLGPFTGGCHFPAGCRRFEDSCSSCPQLSSDPFDVPAAVLRDKRELWPLDDLTIVAPSHWMAGEARRSSLFRDGARLEVIPNGVDPRVFRPLPQAEARAALGIPLSGTYVLCGADQGLEKRKGFGLLRRILDDCIRDPGFLCAGGGILHLGPLPPTWAGADWPLTSLGPLADERGVALAYAAADLFVVPSLEDNLPNMVLEALGSGRPVVAFGVGGIPEVVRDAWSGRIVAAGDAAGMKQAILDLVADPERRTVMGQNARASIEKEYSTSVQADRHVALYAALLERAGARPTPQCEDSAVHAPTDPGPTVGALLASLTIHCLHEAWQLAEADRVARGEVIEKMQGELRRFEEECAARLRVIEELDAHRKWQESVLATRLPAHERRFPSDSSAKSPDEGKE